MTTPLKPPFMPPKVTPAQPMVAPKPIPPQFMPPVPTAADFVRENPSPIPVVQKKSAYEIVVDWLNESAALAPRPDHKGFKEYLLEDRLGVLKDRL